MAGAAAAAQEAACHLVSRQASISCSYPNSCMIWVSFVEFDSLAALGSYLTCSRTMAWISVRITWCVRGANGVCQVSHRHAGPNQERHPEHDVYRAGDVLSHLLGNLCQLDCTAEGAFLDATVTFHGPDNEEVPFLDNYNKMIVRVSVMFSSNNANIGARLVVIGRDPSLCCKARGAQQRLECV